MGNLFSLFEENKQTSLSTCPICNEPVFKGRYMYSNLECSQCKERLGEYYHPECWTSFRETCIDKLICYKCYTNFIQNNNELP